MTYDYDRLQALCQELTDYGVHQLYLGAECEALLLAHGATQAQYLHVYKHNAYPPEVFAVVSLTIAGVRVETMRRRPPTTEELAVVSDRPGLPCDGNPLTSYDLVAQ